LPVYALRQIGRQRGQQAAVVRPGRIGHPSDLPGEPNYLKLLLMPLGLYRPIPVLKRTPRLPA